MSEPRVAVAARAARAGATLAHERFRTGIDVENKTGKTNVVTAADRDAQAAVAEAIREKFPEDVIVGEEGDAEKEVPDEGAAWIVDPIDGTNNYVRDIPFWVTAVAAVVDGEPVATAIDAPALGESYLADDRTAVAIEGPIDADLVAETADSGSLVGLPGANRMETSDRTDPETCAVAPTVWWGFDRRDEYARACEGIVTRFADLRRVGCAQLELAMLATGALDGVITNVQCNPWDSVAGVHLVRTADGRVTDLDGEPWRYDSRGLVASNGGVHEDVLEAARTIDP
ncbi:inositol monophosphatase family protein [Halalkaliarchaeum desulfuricum]|nr:inositol monophosphatase [Halalkaliarchaeum desulfuricum]